MDIISTAIVALVVCVVYDLVLRNLVLPLIKKMFNKTDTPTQG